jgi:hypothetical protein
MYKWVLAFFVRICPRGKDLEINDGAYMCKMTLNPNVYCITAPYFNKFCFDVFLDVHWSL